MNCPNCGTAIVDDQQYCRTCGAELIPAERRLSDYQVWAISALALMFCGLLVAMGAKIWGVKWLIFAGVIMTIAGMFGMAAYGLLQQTRPRRSRTPSSPKRDVEILRADTTNKLPPLREDFIPSVVDDTTELLKTPVERKKTDA